jgi:hypothetical protein
MICPEDPHDIKTLAAVVGGVKRVAAGAPADHRDEFGIAFAFMEGLSLALLAPKTAHHIASHMNGAAEEPFPAEIYKMRNRMTVEMICGFDPEEQAYDN